MAKSLPPTNRKSSRFVIMAFVSLLLVAGYFGAYYANIEMRIEVPGLNVNGSIIVESKYNSYRIGQKQSEVIFWPAERIDAVLRP